MIADGDPISRVRTSCMMKQQGLESKSKRKFKATTNSEHGRPVAPNLLNREFSVEHPDSAYAGDITYIHTDEGWLYLAVLIDLYQKTLKDHEFICSISRKGNCWDNVPSKSFFHILKTELTHHRRYQNWQEAKQEIFEYIEVFYNRQRRHSTIGYQTPLGYENEYRKVA